MKAKHFHLALAAKTLKRIQDGKLSLNQMVEVPPQRDRAIAEVARTLFEYYASGGR